MSIKKNLEEKFEKEYNPRAVKVALYYAKKYGLDYGNNSTYNNEADAFKHTYASALVSLEEGRTINFFGGWYHELTNTDNDLGEFKMDTNNNKIGRDIANEIRNEYGNNWHKLTDNEKDDIIAQKVYRKMQEEKIILDPSGRRKLKNIQQKWDRNGNVTYENTNPQIKSAPKQSLNRFGNVTGYAADITTEEKQDIINHYREEGLCNNMSDEELLEFDKRVKEAHLFDPENRVFYENEFRPADAPKGSNDELGRIFGRATALA